MYDLLPTQSAVASAPSLPHPPTIGLNLGWRRIFNFTTSLADAFRKPTLTIVELTFYQIIGDFFQPVTSLQFTRPPMWRKYVYRVTAPQNVDPIWRR